MNSARSNRPFHEWVPRPLGIIVLLLMFVPPTFSGGAYLSNLSEMTDGLGVWPEDIQLAAFFTSIGMCLFPPFMLRFLQARRVKQTYLYCFALLFILNYICATTTSTAVLLATCLLTGFVRAVVMIHSTFTIAPYLTGMDTLAMFTMTEEPTPDVQYQLERKRTFLMPVLYFYILLIAQGSNVVTAWFAYHYQWQQVYYVVMGMLLVGMLLVMLTMPDEKNTTRYRPEWGMMPELLLMAAALCSLTFVCVYGKTLDWWDSTAIRVGTAVFLFSVAGFIALSLRPGKVHYLPLEVFRFRNILLSMLLFFLSMIFNSANAFVGTLAKLSTPADNYLSASLSGWAVLGCFIGLVLSLVLVIRKVRFRTVFLIAFLLMAAANIYMYFHIQSEGDFGWFVLPMILNFSGLLMLYSLVAAFGMKRLPSRYLVTFVFLMIWMRNAIAPVVGSSLYGNWMNERQQHYIHRLASDMQADRQLIATTKLRITKQATLLAMKDITGKTIWLLLGTAALVMILPYHHKETT